MHMLTYIVCWVMGSACALLGSEVCLPTCKPALRPSWRGAAPAVQQKTPVLSATLTRRAPCGGGHGQESGREGVREGVGREGVGRRRPKSSRRLRHTMMLRGGAIAAGKASNTSELGTKIPAMVGNNSAIDTAASAGIGKKCQGLVSKGIERFPARMLVCVLPTGTQLANGLRHLCSCFILARHSNRELRLGERKIATVSLPAPVPREGEEP